MKKKIVHKIQEIKNLSNDIKLDAFFAFFKNASVWWVGNCAKSVGKILQLGFKRLWAIFVCLHKRLQPPLLFEKVQFFVEYLAD